MVNQVVDTFLNYWGSWPPGTRPTLPFVSRGRLTRSSFTCLRETKPLSSFSWTRLWTELAPAAASWRLDGTSISLARSVKAIWFWEKFWIRKRWSQPRSTLLLASRQELQSWVCGFLAVDWRTSSTEEEHCTVSWGFTRQHSSRVTETTCLETSAGNSSASFSLRARSPSSSSTTCPHTPTSRCRLSTWWVGQLSLVASPTTCSVTGCWSLFPVTLSRWCNLGRGWMCASPWTTLYYMGASSSSWRSMPCWSPLWPLMPRPCPRSSKPVARLPGTMWPGRCTRLSCRWRKLFMAGLFPRLTFSSVSAWEPAP